MASTEPAMTWELPEHVRQYALEAGASRLHVSPEGMVAVGDLDASETDPRILLEPANDHSRPRGRPLIAVSDGSRHLIEGERTTSGGGTFVASVHTNSRGLVTRYLEFGCRAVCDPPGESAAAGVRPGHAATVVHDYFSALDSGDFAAAAACFSGNVLYSHPPYRHTGIDSDARVEFRGHEELLDAFHRRGRTDFGHEVLVLIQQGSHALMEGRVDDLPDGRTGSFISSLTLDVSGRISRYVSFYCEPSIPVTP